MNEKPENVDISPPVPLKDIPDGGSMTVASDSSDAVHIVKNHGGVYSCDCAAWRFQKGTRPEQRTCKHIIKIRGEEAEKWRINPFRKKPDKATGMLVTNHEPSKFPVDATERILISPAVEIAVLLALVWDESIDPTGKLASKKLDGVRAYWKAATRQLLSRQGNEFMAPEWFKQGFPDFDLDGELYGGVGSFQETVGIVKRLAEDEGWKTVKYFVFDIPSSEPFTERYAKLQQWVATSKPPCVTLVEQIPCKGREHLQEMLDAELALGGEGIMLRDPSSSYERKRSKTLLKVKKMLDAEARVIGHTSGTGKYKGMLGALMCELPNGVHVKLGTGLSDIERASPPPIGTVVNYGYQELTEDGIPRFPRFLRVSEKTWETVLDDAKKNGDLDGISALKAAETTPALSAEPKPKKVKSMATAVTKPKASPGPTIANGVLYHYDLVNESINANKFWEIKVDGNSITVRYGRNGTSGQSQSTTEDTPDAALAEASKKVKGKEKEGYILK